MATRQQAIEYVHQPSESNHWDVHAFEEAPTKPYRVARCAFCDEAFIRFESVDVCDYCVDLAWITEAAVVKTINLSGVLK